MKRRCVIDRGIGETRAAVYEGRRLVEYYIRRWSDAQKPWPGDIFAGRITKLDPSIGGAFVDCGAGLPGLLKFSNASGAPRFSEGQMIKVTVIREAVAEKGPVLRYMDSTELSKPTPLVRVSIEDFLKRRFGFDIHIEEAAISDMGAATSHPFAIVGGGNIYIERTRALIAIDVDKEGAQNGFNVSTEAAKLCAQQLRLYGLGGIIAIDFPNIRQSKQREALYNIMQEAFENDPSQIKLAPLSRFGVMEMTRSKQLRSIDEIKFGQGGEPTVETTAVGALQVLEREALASPGAQLTLTVDAQAHVWLERDDIGWREAMSGKYGARFRLVRGEKTHVSADR